MHLQAHRWGRNTRAFTPLRISVAAIVAANLMFSGAQAETSVSPPIAINGATSTVVALERDGSVFVPVRGVFEKLGATVGYSAPAAIVVHKNGSDLVQLTLGSRQATVNGTAHTETVAPFASHGHVMVPLRLISEAAGATVAYVATPRSINISRAIAAVATQQVAQAAPGATSDVSNAAADTQTASQGFPWWLLILAALLIAGLIWYFLNRRKKDAVITTSASTRTSDDPKITTRR